jgi:hypothetical protein
LASLASEQIIWYHIFVSASIKNGTKKKRGRPATGWGIQVGLRWHPDMIRAIDAWAARQHDKPERAEAIRRLVALGLAGESLTNAKRKKG